MPNITLEKPSPAPPNGTPPSPWPVLSLFAEEDVQMPVPNMVYSVKVRMGGTMPENTVGLILPRSEVTFSGTHVSPAVVTDPSTDVMYLAAWAAKPNFLRKGYTVAFLMFISTQAVDPLPRKHPSAFPVIEIGKDRPSMTLVLGGRKVTGLLDTGADLTVVASRHWPEHWPTAPTPDVFGVGGLVTARRSLQPVVFQTESGKTIVTQPHILDIPITLWGRDLLAQGGATLHTNF